MQPQSLVKSFLQQWKRNLVARGFLWWLVIIPPLISWTNLSDKPIWLAWVLIALIVIWIVWMSKWAWKITWGSYKSQRPPPPTPEQEWEARFKKIAVSTDDLPQGLTLASFCQEYDEKVLKQAMHILHRTPPGRRHLRVALQELL